MSDQRDGGIAWTEETWNPIRGCTRVSQGCVNCYAEKVAHRFNGPGLAYEGLTTNGRWNGTIAVVDEHMHDPLRWTRPRMVFVNSMSDLFHENVDDATIDRIFAVMALAQRHTFQILTKRAERARDYLNDPVTRERIGTWISVLLDDADAPRSLRVNPHARRTDDARATAADVEDDDFWPLPNVWLGVSAEDQATADERVPLLLATPAAVRWVSAEPLLGPIDFEGGGRGWLTGHDDGECPVSDPDCTSNDGECHDACEPRPHLDWIVPGGESGDGARPCALEWVERIVRDVRQAGRKVFVKQTGAFVVSELRTMAVAPADRHKLTKFDFAPNGEAWAWRCTPAHPKGGNPDEWPAEIQVREFPAAGGR